MHGPEFVNTVRRAYSTEEIKTRCHTEPRMTNYGFRTILIPYGRDFNGVFIQSQKRPLFNRLSKIQQSQINSFECIFWDARPNLITLCNNLSIPIVVKETAWRIYTRVVKKKFTIGRKNNAFLATGVYIAIRIHEFPLILEEIIQFFPIHFHVIHRAIRLIKDYILPELNLQYKKVSISICRKSGKNHNDFFTYIEKLIFA